MKKILLLFLLITACNALFSQDLVVYDENDSLNCQISEIKDGLLYFNVTRDHKEISTYLPLERIVSYTKDYYFDTAEDAIHKKKNDYARFRIAVAGGYSYRTAGLPSGVPSEVKDYYRKSKNGFHYGVEFNYYFNKFAGIGINYYASRFNPAGDNPVWYPDKIAEKIRIQQIIPTFSMRVFDRQKQGAFLASIGIGYVDYKDKLCRTDLNNLHFGTMKGQTVGMLWSVGYDVPLSQTMAIYFQASLTGGVITKFTLTDEITGETESISVDDVDDGEGLGRLNLSIGLRFTK